MSLRYHIDHAAATLHVVGEGTITQNERLETMRSWMRDPQFRPGLNTLCDFSSAASAPSLPQLREIVALINRHAAAIGTKRLAMIASTPVAFGAARQFQALAESSPIRVQVFSDRRSALEWLKLK